MGNAKSTNVAKAVVDIYSRVAAETVQSSQISSNNTQIISITNTAGDVNITGNVITQKVNLNMSTLMDSLSTVESQQKISEQLDQLAKSVVSGLNFFTFDDAKNTAESIVKSQTDITNAIRQTCSLTSNNFQKITVKNTQGSVNIENNVLSQIVDIFDKCALKSVLGVKVIDDVQNRIDQSAEAKIEGFNLVWLILVIAAIILVPIFAAGRAASTALRFVFPLMILLGVVFFSLFFALGKTYMKSTYFTKPFLETCSGKIDTNVTSTTLSVRQAHEECLKTSTCQVVDARLTNKGTEVRIFPEIKYFNSGSGCSFQIWDNKVSDLTRADVTSVKTKQRYNWLLYVGIALILGGAIGLAIQVRGGRGGRASSSVASSDIELSTFRTSETAL